MMEDFRKNIFCYFKKEFSLVIDTLNSSDKEVVLRGILKNSKDVELFIEILKMVTHTEWVIYYQKTIATKFIYHKVWKCQHSSKNKKSPSNRNADCIAKLDIKIKKISRYTRKRDKYLRVNPPLPCIIKLGLSHSHEINTPSSLRMLRVNKEVQTIFFLYFNLDMGPTESQRFHQQLLLEIENPEIMVDASINPSLRQIIHLYNIWRSKNLGSLSKILEKMTFNVKKEDRNQVTELKSMDCNSERSLLLPDSNCTTVETTNISCSQIIKEAMLTSEIDAKSLASEKICRTMLNPSDSNSGKLSTITVESTSLNKDSEKTPETSTFQTFTADENLKNPSATVDATLLNKVSETAQKSCTTVSNLTTVLNESPAVTVITLCCTDTKEGIAFHRFLQDPEQRTRWISRTKCQNLKPSQINVLCPKHFNEEPENCQSEFKENRVQNIFELDSLSQEKDVGLFQIRKEVIPVNHEEETTNDKFSELHGNCKEVDKIYVKVKWNETVNKIAEEKVQSLHSEIIPINIQNLPIRLPQKARKTFLNPVVRIKRMKIDRMCSQDLPGRSLDGTNPDGFQKIQMHLTEATKKELVYYARKKLRAITCCYSSNIQNKSVIPSKIAETKNIDSVSSSSDIVREANNLIASSVETMLAGEVKPISTAADFTEKKMHVNNSLCYDRKEEMDSNTSHSKIIEERICSNYSHNSDTGMESSDSTSFLKIVNIEGGIDPLNFEGRTEIKNLINYDDCIGTIKVPNAWWGITHTPQYIICSKWNECYEPIFRVIIQNDNNVKIFIKGRECVNDSKKVPFQNISSLLQEVDSYEICAGISDKSMSYCMGHLEKRSQEPFSIWCKGCQKKGKELMERFKLR